MESDVQKVSELDDEASLTVPEATKEPKDAPVMRSFIFPVVGTF
jgi:hypothetical protein